eukprot:490134_1
MAVAHSKTPHLETLPPVAIEGRTSNNTNRNCTKPQTLQIKTPPQTETVQNHKHCKSKPQTETSTVRKADLIQIGIIARAACACVILIGSPAFISLLFVLNYTTGSNESAKRFCGNTKYLIDLHIYLYIAIGAQLGIFVIFALSKVIALLFCCENVWIKIKTLLNNRWCNVITIFYLLFNIVWACIGIYIYTQMNDDCKEEAIATVLLFWSIIPFICVCCVMCLCWACSQVVSTEPH